MILKEVIEVENTLKKLGEELITNGEEAFESVKKMTKYISEIYTDFLGIIPSLQESGVDIPSTLLIEQLNKYMDAMKNEDVIMLMDNINYEILDTITLYREILEQICG